MGPQLRETGGIPITSPRRGSGTPQEARRCGGQGARSQEADVSEPGSRISEKVGSVHGSAHRIGPPQSLHRRKYHSAVRPAAPTTSTPAMMAAIHRRPLLRPVLAGAVSAGVKLRSWEFMRYLVAPGQAFAYPLDWGTCNLSADFGLSWVPLS